MRRKRRNDGSDRGFTLLELLVVVAIVGILAALVAPQFMQTPQRAKEAVLKEDLYVLRDVIDQFFVDKGRYPDSLQSLVDEGYLRAIPVDPFTQSADTWQVETTGGDEDTEGGGIFDVHSGAEGQALDGSYYSEW